jgi:hypothetical protein
LGGYNVPGSFRTLVVDFQLFEPGWVSWRRGLVVLSFHFVRGGWNVSGGCEGLELEGWQVVQALVETAGVEPGDVFDDRGLELCAVAPDTVGDQLGLEGVDEAFRERVDAPIVVKRWFWLRRSSPGRG